MNFRSMLRRAAIVLVLFLPSAAPAQALKFPGSLNFFLDDPAIWKLSAEDLAARLGPSGYAPDPKSGHHWLGEPREMLKRQAHLISPDNPVWGAQLAVGLKLNSAQFNFLPPASIAKTPDRNDWRALIKRLEEGLTAVLGTKPSAHPPEILYPEADSKSLALRWITPSVSAVLTAYHRESARTFTPVLLQVRLTPAATPGKPSISKPPVPAADRKTGTVILEGLPPLPEWEGSHADWAIIEQALHAAGLASDRNGIREHHLHGISWPEVFCLGMQRIAAMSGGRAVALEPYVLAPASMPKLLTELTAAGKKLNRPAPHVLQNIHEVDSVVLRAARTRGNTVPLLMSAVKKALAAGRPVVWYGFRGIYAEEPAVPPGSLALSLRLIIGCAPAEESFIFAGPDGKPGARIKAADALAASFYIADIQRK
jgi:hypothetical protein